MRKLKNPRNWRSFSFEQETLDVFEEISSTLKLTRAQTMRLLAKLAVELVRRSPQLMKIYADELLRGYEHEDDYLGGER